MILQLQDISKHYGKQRALKNVSFSIDKGEIVGFLGPNGAGKSTTMKIISGVIASDGGQVLIKDIDLKHHPLAAKKNIGFLPEDNPLYEDMYVYEYIDYVAEIYSIDNKKERIQNIFRQIGLRSEIDKKIEYLSKGYKQRVGLAQAIIHDPDLLILDEPTSGLDPNQIEEIHQLLILLSKEKGILFSSHTLSEVATICTRILFIHRGEIKADLKRDQIGDLESLFKELTNNQK